MWPVLISVLAAHPAMPPGKTCESCHPAQARENAASAHGRAWSNPLFQLSFVANGQRRWCVGCHDPQGGERAIGCTVCHDATFTKVTDAACVSCHQFKAPEQHFVALAMQDTVEEWRRSASKEGCVDCHFADGNHRSAGGHDLELLQKTLAITWTGACATVTATGAGHAVPTGDPFHHLRLALCADETCATPIGRKYLLRKLVTGADGGLELASDTRPFPSTKVCFSQLKGATRFRLELVHAEAHLAAEAPPDEASRVVLEGPLPTK